MYHNWCTAQQNNDNSIDRAERWERFNGREFAGFKQIAAETHAEYYFADPYASWQRSTNENKNGLIRQYFSKKCDFRTITDEQIQEAMDKLNNRPRKCLGFRTPNEVLLEAQTVALTN